MTQYPIEVRRRAAKKLLRAVLPVAAVLAAVGGITGHYDLCVMAGVGTVAALLVRLFLPNG
jgi:hypothetical protein